LTGLSVGSPLGDQMNQVTIPYTFTMDHETHMLHTTWEVSGDMSISSVCAYATVTMMEISWTGEAEELSSGYSVAVYCQESQTDLNKLQIDVDVTKFRVQPFRSYKVCISVDDYDYTADYIAAPVCTHLFSFEKYVPYNPDMEVESVEDKSDLKEDMVSDDADINYVKSEKRVEEEVIENKQKEEEVIESVLKQQLDNIENFVRDDFKVKYLELKDELIEKVEDKILHTNSVENLNGPKLIMIMPLILARTFLNMVMM